MNQHPNASVAALAGAVTILVVWAVSLAGYEMPPEVSAAMTTLVVALILYLGRRRPKGAR